MTNWPIRVETVKSGVRNAKVHSEDGKEGHCGLWYWMLLKERARWEHKPYHCQRPQEGQWEYEGEQFLYNDQSGWQIEQRSRYNFWSDAQSAVKGQFSQERKSFRHRTVIFELVGIKIVFLQQMFLNGRFEVGGYNSRVQGFVNQRSMWERREVNVSSVITT